MFRKLIDIHILLIKIFEYEPSLYDNIKAVFFYKFKDNLEFREAINLWFDNNEEALKLYGPMDFWDTSNITDMSNLFKWRNSFNYDINSWDTSNVTNMRNMFYGAEEFNQNIAGWDTSNVTNMWAMFHEAEEFNQDISSWDTSKVIDMQFMFCDATKFNQDISSWDTSNVTNMACMFLNAESFRYDIRSWDNSNLRSYYHKPQTFNRERGNNSKKLKEYSFKLKNGIKYKDKHENKKNIKDQLIAYDYY